MRSTSVQTDTVQIITVQTGKRSYDLEVATVDLYRDIHKGIRAELFAITSTAGSLDPTDHGARLGLADHAASVAHVLAFHAEREDAVIEPVLVQQLPDLAERILADHHSLETRFASLVELAVDAAAIETTVDAQRRLGHLLYLELSDFTSAYLVHQLVEERDVMPALEGAVGIEAVADLQAAIVSSIPPEELARSLAFMFPAMNADDRGELLGNLQASAPAEVFARIASLTRSVLDPVELAATVTRVPQLANPEA